MSSLGSEAVRSAAADTISVTEETLTVHLEDGSAISVPLTWYPRLFHATNDERANRRFIGGGRGIHWPDLDEDISVMVLLLGVPSGESQPSLRRWLSARE